MDKHEFKEALLAVMERKDHWAWPAFGSGLVPKDRLCIHLQQEYGTYVRDFPILVARAYVSCPIAVVRRELIENVFEEETGRLSAGRPHPELFLEYPRGLGMSLRGFHEPELLPGAQKYRAYIDEMTLHAGWDTAAAISTLFIEGTKYDRGELDPSAQKRPEPPLEEHPLVKHYGLPVQALALTRAHRAVEGGHRQSAWKMVLDYVASERRLSVVQAMQGALAAWLEYRDDVAKACGLERGPEGPRLSRSG